MPVIITRGGMSARGGGTFAYVPPPPPPPPPPPSPTPTPPPPPNPTYQTVTFTSSQYWTVPAGITYLNVVYGKGQDGGESFIGWTAPFPFACYALEATTPYAEPGDPNAFVTYAQAGAIADAILAAVNVGAPAERPVSFTRQYFWYNPSTKGYYTTTEEISVVTRGYVTPSTGPWDNRSNAIASGIGNGWGLWGEIQNVVPAYAGEPARAFGLTFPGGPVAQPATPVSYSNITVTPGAQYYIDVPNGAYVSVQFVQ